jgi:SPP1 gp7 family putative phage head morphogenesis protein
MPTVDATKTQRQSRAETKKQRAAWLKARKAEVKFARILRGLARRIGTLTNQLFDADDMVQSSVKIREVLTNYAKTLYPWAEKVAARMVADVMRRDAVIWETQAREIGRSLRKEIETTPTGELFRKSVKESTKLITSLPREAGQRVGQLAVRALAKSGRANEIAKEILKTGHVTKSRAQTIARTQVSTTASLLVKVRAEHVGSEGYFWRTAGDSDVRPDHQALNGKFIKWSEPPIADRRSGIRAHAGCIFNCRCWAEPVLLDEPQFRVETA